MDDIVDVRDAIVPHRRVRGVVHANPIDVIVDGVVEPGDRVVLDEHPLHANGRIKSVDVNFLAIYRKAINGHIIRVWQSGADPYRGVKNRRLAWVCLKRNGLSRLTSVHGVNVRISWWSAPNSSIRPSAYQHGVSSHHHLTGFLDRFPG